MLAFVFSLFLAICIVGTFPVSAAEIKKPSPALDDREVVLEGKIESGDFEKLQSFLFANYPQEIYLASPVVT